MSPTLFKDVINLVSLTMNKKINIKSLKFPDKLHLQWPAEIIYINDEWLVTLASPGTLVKHHTRNIEYTLKHFSLSIFSTKNNYNVMIDFDENGSFQKIYCNIALPADWSKALEVSWIDLDFDIIVTEQEGAKLIDKDEFDERFRNGIYPSEIANLATDTAMKILAIADSGLFPFLKSSLSNCLLEIEKSVENK